MNYKFLSFDDSAQFGNRTKTGAATVVSSWSWIVIVKPLTFWWEIHGLLIFYSKKTYSRFNIYMFWTTNCHQHFLKKLKQRIEISGKK
jgi:hypothetical protein